MLDFIVITAPTNESCAIYMQQLSPIMTKLAPEAALICVSDPPQCRLGSGGGTLNALSYLDQSNIETKRVAVIHSGGESRRAPLHSVCGKCFATFNSTIDDQLATPIVVLITELQLFCHNIQGGFCIIASSDVLLDINRIGTVIPANAFSVVAVPEDIHTATNHGVIITTIRPDHNTTTAIVSNYLQKPKVEAMAAAGALLEMDPTTALIDTGIVIITGTAFLSFISLMEDPIIGNCCFGHRDATAKRLKPDVDVKIELYSDILLALSYLQETPDFDGFKRRLNIKTPCTATYEQALHSIWETLRVIPLYGVVIKTGRFAHLGTSAELLDLMTYPLVTPEVQSDAKLEFFSEKYHFRRVVDSVVDEQRWVQGTIVNSICVDQVHCAVGSLVEHSILTGECHVAERSMVSHVFGAVGKDLIVPPATMVQLVGIKSMASVFAVIILGLHDDVKAAHDLPTAKIYGQPWSTWMDKFQLTPDDLWSADAKDKSLWTARIHPVLDNSTQVPDLLFYLGTGCETPAWWRQAPRVSLAELLEVGDASQMFSLRNYLQAFMGLKQSASFDSLGALSRLYTAFAHTIASLKAITPFNPSNLLLSALILRATVGDKTFTTLSNSYPVADNASETVSECVMRLFETPEFRASSCFLVILETCKKDCALKDLTRLSSFLTERISDVPAATVPRILIALAWLLRGRSLDTATIARCKQTLLTQLDEFIISKYFDEDASSSLDESIESIAQKVIYTQIQESLSACPLLTSDATRTHLAAGAMVVASAPVRVDLAGGWSDTPPICYESSGAVMNVAVRVNGTRPMCCTARNISQLQIQLKTYRLANDAASSVVLHESVTLDFADDFDAFFTIRNPSDPCVLLKAAFLVLGVREKFGAYGGDLRTFLMNEFGGGCEICSFSGLPAGSGMGGSSILAAVVLAAIGRLQGIDLSRAKSDLVSLVTAVEQAMTTGGGWQDQIGGVFPAFKIGRSPKGLPLRTSVEMLPMDRAFNAIFESRSCLIYTGTQRLAKNTLVNALRSYSLCPYGDSDESVVYKLRVEAESIAECMKTSVLQDEDAKHEAVNRIGEALSRYWQLKKAMAAGSEPADIKSLLGCLQPHCVGLSLCGAGAGGYAACILRRGVQVDDIRTLISTLSEVGPFESMQLTVSTLQIDNDGLLVYTRASNDSVVSIFIEHALVI